MVNLLALTAIEPNVWDDITDITKLAGSIGITGGLIWVIVLLARTAWRTVLNNTLNDNERLRIEIGQKDALIDTLRKELRTAHNRVDELEGALRDAKSENRKLKKDGKDFS